MSKILVIDDDPQARRAIVDLLSAAGHEVLQAQDGREGLGLFRCHRPGLIITDIVMPNMDGLETIRLLRTEAQGPPIIALSERCLPNTALYLRMAKMMGADEAMAKPLSASDLIEAVDRLA